jgi:nitrite reductase/ring-hydroxylating ferredoxin subunit
MKLDESCLARRRFLCGMLGGGAAAMGAGLFTPLLQYAGNFCDAPLPDFLALEKSDYELRPGKAKMIRYGPLPVLLLQPQEAGQPLRAFLATCTHLNCTVAYQEAQNRIYCACHDGSYDTAGRVLSGPPPRPLQQLFSKLAGGKLILAVEQDNLEKAP